MPTRLAVAVLLAAVGCNRHHTRPGGDRPPPPFPPPVAATDTARTPVPVPTPPPPPLPRDAVGSSGVVPAAAVAPSDDGTSRREERKERRDDRRERRTDTPTPPAAVSPTAPPPAEPSPPAPADVRALLAAAEARYARVPDFAGRLTKREVVGGKAMPAEEAEYRYRQQPLSVYLRVTGEAGQGREVLYVAGKDDGKLWLVTGKGDHFLRGVKVSLSPDDPKLTAKSRYKITEAGFGRTLAGLATAVGVGAATVVGPATRPDYPHPLTQIDARIPPGQEPQLPKGGTRTVFLDADPKSPAHLLPVLVVTREPDGTEVEYYRFDQLKVPAGLTDADFDAGRLGKRK